ncbi:MAG: ABC transporter substrate-binding protein [Myxococcota bacterium]|nr:ABC transporter substrate-binding protein [Myxococcota bacterium]
MIGILLLGCHTEGGDRNKTGRQNDPAVPTSFPRKETLYVGGWDWAAPHTFNRLAPDPNWPIDGIVQIMYEALFGYDQLSGEMKPHLARNLMRRHGGFEVTLDDRARWSNGDPVTADDVVYTFELDRRYPTVRRGMWQYLKRVKKTGSNKVLFELSPDNPNPLYVLDYLCENVILPQKVWREIEKKSRWNIRSAKADYMTLLRFKNDRRPVVSGPYNLLTYSQQKIVLERRENYWGTVKYGGRKPGPKYIIHSIYSGNAQLTAAMVKGQLDLAIHFMPRIWAKKKYGIRAWQTDPPYHVAASIPVLFMALNKAPFNDVAFRRALAHAIDTDRIRTLAMSQYSPKLKPGLILPLGPEAEFYSAEDAARYGYTFDRQKALALLREAGYLHNAEGNLQRKDGRVMRRLTVECPRGWSDWENAVRVVVKNLSDIGISAVESLVDYGRWKQNLSKGLFDLSIETSTPALWPSTPWRRFAQIMSNKNLRPAGQTIYKNYGRYNDSVAQEMIDTLPGIEDRQQLASAYRALNIKFMQELPALPLAYRPSEFHQFSEKHWQGFPTKDNPTAPPQCLMIGAGISGLWHLYPRAKNQ